MTLAMDEATGRWPEATVTQMPHNNPGYDIAVQYPVKGTRYIEVKGTRLAEPCFFITAGEVEHSRNHPDRYSIWILPRDGSRQQRGDADRPRRFRSPSHTSNCDRSRTEAGTSIGGDVSA
ncbi:DUF3883 domain-containing protein [Mycolicibacter algericus]|uniref:DUF3883 domain-containing protein n=1 Tax=Mycolicibacter algericus TaxID=1288388 RepID=UPI003C7108A5